MSARSCCVAPGATTVPEPGVTVDGFHQLTPPAEARRLHPLSPLIAAAPLLRQVGLSLVLVVVTESRLLLAMLAVGVVVFLVPTVVRTWFTRYTLDDEQLLVWSGALQRSVRVVAPARVQQVELIRQLRHRATDLAAVRIDLVGSGSSATRIELDALPVAEAERVRDTLERGRRRLADIAAPIDVPAPPPAPVLRVGTRHLVVGGLTGTPVLLVPFLLLSVLFEASDLIRQGTGAEAEPRGWLAVVLIIGGIAVWPIVAGGLMILRFHGYELARSGDDLVVRRGLLETRTSVLPLPRVQLVHRSATLPRQWLGLASLDIRTASGTSEGTPGWVTTVPVAPTGEVDALIPVALGREALQLDVAPHPTAACRRAIVRRLLSLAAPVLVITAGTVAAGGSWPAVVGTAAALLGVVAFPVSLLWGRAWYQRLGHRLAEGVLIARDGVLVEHARIVPIDRVQTVSIRQNHWQRRAGVCTAQVHLAGSSARVVVRDPSVVDALAIVEAVRGLQQVDVSRWSAVLSDRA